MDRKLNPEASEFYPALNSIVQDGYLHTHKTIRVCNRFPIGTSYELFKTFTDFNILTSKIRENVVIQSNQIMAKELSSVKLKCSSGDETNTEKIIDANDSFLERININIDTLCGVNQPSEAFLSGVQAAAWSHAPIVATIKVKDGPANLNIARPQLAFKDAVDNTDTLFVPKIPKNISGKDLDVKIVYNEQREPIGYEHPYEKELKGYSPPKWGLEAGEKPAFPPKLEATTLKLLQTEEQLDDLILHLDEVNEIAVDLEHHSYRSYQGFTCLIQISTDEGGDFLLDALALREHIHKLNKPFTDPQKIKVFHGADNDIQWLQRDFGVCVVGLFDTHQAARALNFPFCSLKHLLQHYCGVYTDKSFQLADWRVRPLPEELMQYARIDTHYLLYIWRSMRRDLLAKDETPPRLLLSVFENSKLISALTYKKSSLREEPHMPLYLRSGKVFGKAQLAALRLVYSCRDQYARDLDESVAYMLPDHMLLALAEHLPQTVQGILALCNPPPPLVRLHAAQLHRLIRSCFEMPGQLQVQRMPLVELQPVILISCHKPLYDCRLGAVYTQESWLVVPSACAAPWTNAPLFRCDAPARRARRGRLNASVQIFVPPYDRYRMYRVIAQGEELKALKAEEARVLAINVGERLTRHQALPALEQAAAEPGPSDAATDPTPPALDSHPVHEFAVPTPRNTKIFNNSKSRKHPQNKGDNKDAAPKPFAYKNANYKNFYRENKKRSKQPKQ